MMYMKYEKTAQCLKDIMKEWKRLDSLQKNNNRTLSTDQITNEINAFLNLQIADIRNVVPNNLLGTPKSMEFKKLLSLLTIFGLPYFIKDNLYEILKNYSTRDGENDSPYHYIKDINKKLKEQPALNAFVEFKTLTSFVSNYNFTLEKGIDVSGNYRYRLCWVKNRSFTVSHT